MEAVTIKPLPVVTSDSSLSVCNGIATPTVTFSASLAGSTYSWTNSYGGIGLGVSGADSIASFIPVNTTTVQEFATISIKATANGCTGPAQSFDLTVNPTPMVILPATGTVCNGSASSTVLFSSLEGGTSYSWSTTDTALGLPSSGTGSIAPFTGINAGIAIDTGKIYVTPYANGCTGSTAMYNMVVFPTPVFDLPSNQVLCNSNMTGAVNFSSVVSGSSFTWVNSNSSIGLSASGAGNIAAFTAIDTNSVPDTATIVVTPMANTCIGGSGSFLFVVNPTPNVVPVSVTSYCNGAVSSPIYFNGTVAGTVFNWLNTNTSAGISATGTDSIPSYTLHNIATAPDTVAIQVTPEANGCIGLVQTVQVIIKPTPAVTGIPDQYVCNGALSSPIVFTGPVAGTHFSWSNSNTLSGLGAGGTDVINAFAALDSGTHNDTLIVSVVPNAAGCTGATDTVIFIVKPSPVLGWPGFSNLCNGMTQSTIYFTSNLANTTYSWVNSNTSIGLSASGVDSINSFVAIDTNLFQDSSKVYITQTANGCNGLADSLIIKVIPTPYMNPVPNYLVCTGDSLNVNFSDLVEGTIFNWYNSRISIGLDSMGTGFI